MKKILAFSFFPAFVPPRSGGELRLYNVYRELGRWYEVVLLTSTHHGVAPETVVHGDSFIERRLPKDEHFVAEWQRLQPHAGAGDISSICVGAAARYDTPMVRAYLEEYADADILIHDSPFTVDYDLFIGLDAKLRIYNSYNCESALFRQLHCGSTSHVLHELVDRWERKLLGHADLVAYCSEADLEAFTRLAGGTLKATISTPNGVVPLANTSGALKRDHVDGGVHALFIGSAHLPNVEAAEFIARKLASELPAVTFHVVGACLTEGNYPSNVVSHGQATNELKLQLLNTVDLALNPMSSGGGSNLKILEFFSHGLPVISTAIGVRGFAVKSGDQCYVVELPQFASAVAALADESEVRRRMGRSAQQFAMDHYSWASICRDLHRKIETLPRTPARLLDKPFVLGMNDYDPFVGAGGGAIRIRGLLQAIDARQPVVYLCFGDGRLESEAFATQSVLLRIPKTAEHKAAETEASAASWIAVSDILATAFAPRNPLLRMLYRILREHAAVIVLDHPYLESLLREYGDSFVYSSQNNETLLKRSVLAWHPERDRLLPVVEASETRAVEESACVVAVSEEDAYTLLLGRQQGAPVMVVRNGANAPATPSDSDRATASVGVPPRSVVFMGSAHAPNVEAVRFVVDTLAGTLPNVTFHLIGGSANWVDQPAATNIRVWGDVSDGLKTAILEACDLAINPMFSGGGSNVKLADFIGHGLEVVATPFGRRGYPPEVDTHVNVAEPGRFAEAITAALANPNLRSAVRRAERRRIFDALLSMRSLGQRLAEVLTDLQRPKRRVLFVTYRWVWPLRGGAEAHLLQHISSMARSGDFAIDVVAPDVAFIGNEARFAAHYGDASAESAPIDLPNVRFRRFPVQKPPQTQMLSQLRCLWLAQPMFERDLYQRWASTAALPTALAWGWASPDAPGPDVGRWALSAFAVHLAESARVTLLCSSRQSGALLVTDGRGHLLAQLELAEHFEVCILAPQGEVRFEVSAPCFLGEDPRPLGLYVRSVLIGDGALDLSALSLVCRPIPVDADVLFGWMHAAARTSRSRSKVALTDVRGPHAPALNNFLEEEVSGYDLVLTHNSVFLPAIQAVRAARAAGVPVALLPHAHLDDDFYHFPDVTDAALQADATLVAPRAACSFYRQLGARRVEYMSPGCDVDEVYSDEDVAAFRRVWSGDMPYLLVLGRKAAAKGYRSVIGAVEFLAAQHRIHLVLIGPDDDGQAVVSAHATYLGLQPRNVVRGALRACLALVNMSSSESFGMVLLEAWLAGAPVIVNRHCAAFSDLATDGLNALVTDENGLTAAAKGLLVTPGRREELAAAGRRTALEYAQNRIDEHFLSICRSLVDGKTGTGARP